MNPRGIYLDASVYETCKYVHDRAIPVSYCHLVVRAIPFSYGPFVVNVHSKGHIH